LGNPRNAIHHRRWSLPPWRASNVIRGIGRWPGWRIVDSMGADSNLHVGQAADGARRDGCEQVREPGETGETRAYLRGADQQVREAICHTPRKIGSRVGLDPQYDVQWRHRRGSHQQPRQKEEHFELPAHLSQRIAASFERTIEPRSSSCDATSRPVELAGRALPTILKSNTEQHTENGPRPRRVDRALASVRAAQGA